MSDSTQPASPAGPHSSVPLRELLGLVLLAALLRLILLGHAGVTGPIGPDLPYWSYDALKVSAHTGPLLYPPLLPLLTAAGATVTGASLPWVGWVLILACGALLPAVAAWSLAAVGGRSTGRLAGVLTLLLPAITLASVTVEPTALFLILILLALRSAVGVARDGNVRAAYALGTLGYLAADAKEGGPIDLLLLAAAAVLVAPRRRSTLAITAALAALVVGLAVDLAVPEQLAGKASLPLHDMQRWIVDGLAPAALAHPGDDVGALSASAIAAFASLSPGVRLVRVLGLQGWRLLVLLGPWLLAAPALALVLIHRLRRRQLERWQVALILPHLVLLAGGFCVFIQGRHAEWLAMGSVWAAALVCRKRRWVVAAVLLAALHCGWRLQHVSTALDGLEFGARNDRYLSRWAQEQLPRDSSLASPLVEVGPWLGQLVRGNLERPDPTGRVLVLVKDGLRREESKDGVPLYLAPLALYRTLQTPMARYELYLARTQPAGVRMRVDTMDRNGTLTLGTSPADQATRVRPGRTREDRREEGREDSHSPSPP